MIKLLPLLILTLCTSLTKVYGQDGAWTYPIVSADSINRYVHFLGSDSLMGRETGTPGLEKAAEFIRNHLRSWDLFPAGNNNTFFQKIPMHGSLSLPQSSLKIFLANQERDLVLGKDYLLIKTGAQTLIPRPVPVVFVDYGITAPEYDYNDYQTLDVTGKMVVYFEGEPFSEGDSEYFKGDENTIHNYIESKIRTAVANGAVGSIILPNPRTGQTRDWEHMRREYSLEDVSLPGRVTSHLGIILNKASAKLLFTGARYNYDQLVDLEEKHELHPLGLKCRLSFKGHFRQREFISSNVVSIVKGRQPDEGYLLVTAHYDHLGIGEAVKGDSIYNGVLDNATGSAILMELARVFSTADIRPRRSILFVFLTGEEKGLLGSTYYTQHPLVKLSSTVADINIDGVSAFGNFKDIIPVGADYSDLQQIISDVAAENGLFIGSIPQQFRTREAFARSDQIAFARAGIPSVMIVEGFNYQNIPYDDVVSYMINWFENIYHTPFDDFQQKLDFDSAAMYGRFIFSLCNRLANISYPPQWKEGSPYRAARLQSLAEDR